MNGFKNGLGSAWNSPSRAIKLRYVSKHWLRKSLSHMLMCAGRIYQGETSLHFVVCFIGLPQGICSGCCQRRTGG